MSKITLDWKPVSDLLNMTYEDFQELQKKPIRCVFYSNGGICGIYNISPKLSLKTIKDFQKAVITNEHIYLEHNGRK